MDGTIYLSDTPIGDMINTLKLCRDKGIRIYYFTNNSSKTQDEYVKKLKRIGFYDERDTVYTSAMATIGYINANYAGKTVYAVATEPVHLFLFPADLLLLPGSVEEPHRLTVLNQLLTLISNAHMKQEYRLAILSRKGLRERILTYLTMQADKRHTSSFTVPFTREELASYLCVNRSALSHELSRMQQEGLITFRKNRFTLHTVDPV
jgi:CRP-like cAMP-binding protein